VAASVAISGNFMTVNLVVIHNVIVQTSAVDEFGQRGRMLVYQTPNKFEAPSSDFNVVVNLFVACCFENWAFPVGDSQPLPVFLSEIVGEPIGEHKTSKTKRKILLEESRDWKGIVKVPVGIAAAEDRTKRASAMNERVPAIAKFERTAFVARKPHISLLNSFTE
jgi:hypothetical protein